MKHKSQLLILLAIGLLQAIGFTVKAQNVTFDLTQGPPPQTKDGVSVDYKWCEPGAQIYSSGNIHGSVTVTSTTNIIGIKFEGTAKKQGNVVVSGDNGELQFSLKGTSVWTGQSKSVEFVAADETIEYYVKKIQIWLEGSNFDPSTDNDEEDVLLGEPIERTLSVPVDGKAVKMAIVSTRQFGDLVKEYGDWKTKQGYAVEEVYTEDYDGNGTLSGEALAKAIQSHLIESRPAFVLIMGDIDQVPAFKGTQYWDKGEYVTDYFYGEYSGDDHFPEAYVGRFSGENEDQLRAQMEKTQYMSFLNAKNGEWLKTSMALHNPASNLQTDKGYNYTVDYLQNKLNVDVVKTSASPSINNTINSGCATVTYYGHGMPTSLNGSYTVTNASNLTNANKYPVFIGMTCYTGQFDNGGVCLAEQMQRMPDAGTVAYIGATRESLDQPNMAFMTGGVKDGQTYLGFMASMFPTTSKDFLNQHSRTIGEGVAMGNFGVNAFSMGSVALSSEYYELFGDPTYQPYYTTPITMKVGAPAQATAGHIINIKAAPKAVICISADRTIAAVALTDDTGCAELKLDKTAPAGKYTLYCSAPNYTDWQRTITVNEFDGHENVVDDFGNVSEFDFNDFTRHKVLIEKFTGQTCVNCPPADETLKNYIEENGYEDKVIEMRHYNFTDPIRSGYLKIQPLHTTLSSSWDISSYPSYLVDRCGYKGAKLSSSPKTTAQAISNLDCVDDRFAQPCKVSLSLDGTTYNPATNELKVVASGKVDTSLPDLRINIFVTQSGIIATQTGGGSNYEHNGVSRDAITDINGDVLKKNDDGIFQMTYDYKLPATLGNFATDADKMDVVVFISSWDDYKTKNDFTNSEVYNAENACLGKLPTKALAPVLPGNEPPIEPELTEYSLIDGQPYSASSAKHYDKVTYTRDFTNTKWQALYVPFSIDCEKLEDEYEIARIYNFIDYDDNNDGKFDRTYLVVQKKTTGSTVANTPYLIRAKNTGEHTLVMTNKVLERAETGTVDCGSMDYDYTFYGTYTTINDMFTKGYYALSNGALNKAEDNTVKLKPQRWYMQITTRNGGYPSATHAQNIRILVDGEEDVEGIIANENKHAKDNTTYDLQGRKVKNSIRGVQILNGKKVIK